MAWTVHLLSYIGDGAHGSMIDFPGRRVNRQQNT